MAQLGMTFRQPFNQEVKTAFPALRANKRPPARPVFDQTAKTDQVDDFFVGGVLKHTPGGPILVEAPNRPLSIQDSAELFRIQIVIPNIGNIACHAIILA
jgi:hypothetical protein